MSNDQVKTDETCSQVDNYELTQVVNHELTDEELEIIAGGCSAEVTAGVSHNNNTGTTYSGSVKFTIGGKKK